MSLVLGVLGISLIAVILGVLALRRVARNGTGGRWLAWGGIAAAVAWVAISALIGAVALLVDRLPAGTLDGIALPWASDEDADGNRIVSVDQLAPGDCVLDYYYDERGDLLDEIADVTIVDCTTPHEYEVTALFDITDTDVADGEYPGDRAMVDLALEGCYERTQQRFDELGADFDVYDVDLLHPTRDAWEFGDRAVTCFAYRLDEEKNDTPISAAEPGAGITSSGNPLDDLVPGACSREFLYDLDGDPLPVMGDVSIVDCEAPHEYEVVALTNVDYTEWQDVPYPGDEAVGERAYQSCADYLDAVLNNAAVALDAYDVVPLWSDLSRWAVGERDVACLAYRIDGKINDTPVSAGPPAPDDPTA